MERSLQKDWCIIKSNQLSDAFCVAVRGHKGWGGLFKAKYSLAVSFEAINQDIQKYFALPLYLLCGTLFLYESWYNRDDSLAKPNGWQRLLLVLYLLYPLISFLLGNRFPQMVTHIMPCPVVSLGITVYAGYSRKNKLLLALLTIWGLTGIKSVIFSAYEDIILLICGIYGVTLFLRETKHGMKR